MSAQQENPIEPDNSRPGIGGETFYIKLEADAFGAEKIRGGRAKEYGELDYEAIRGYLSDVMWGVDRAISDKSIGKIMVFGTGEPDVPKAKDLMETFNKTGWLFLEPPIKERGFFTPGYVCGVDPVSSGYGSTSFGIYKGDTYEQLSTKLDEDLKHYQNHMAIMRESMYKTTGIPRDRAYPGKPEDCIPAKPAETAQSLRTYLEDFLFESTDG